MEPLYILLPKVYNVTEHIRVTTETFPWSLQVRPVSIYTSHVHYALAIYVNLLSSPRLHYKQIHLYKLNCFLSFWENVFPVRTISSSVLLNFFKRGSAEISILWKKLMDNKSLRWNKKKTDQQIKVHYIVTWLYRVSSCVKWQDLRSAIETVPFAHHEAQATVDCCHHREQADLSIAHSYYLPLHS